MIVSQNIGSDKIIMFGVLTGEHRLEKNRQV